jgi:hypothetical protein
MFLAVRSNAGDPAVEPNPGVLVIADFAKPLGGILRTQLLPESCVLFLIELREPLILHHLADLLGRESLLVYRKRLTYCRRHLFSNTKHCLSIGIGARDQNGLEPVVHVASHRRRYAWGANTGWIYFAGVTIDSNGLFHGSTVPQSLFGTMTFD